MYNTSGKRGDHVCDKINVAQQVVEQQSRSWRERHPKIMYILRNIYIAAHGAQKFTCVVSVYICIWEYI